MIHKIRRVLSVPTLPVASADTDPKCFVSSKKLALSVLLHGVHSFRPNPNS